MWGESGNEVSFVVWGESGNEVSLSCGESLGMRSVLSCGESLGMRSVFHITKLSLCERHVIVCVRGGKGGEGGEGYLLKEDGVSGKVCEVLEL